MRIRMLVVATIASVATLIGAGAAHAAPAVQPFAHQADAAGLTASEVAAVQAKVDSYLKEVGGRQVALNKIAFAGGELLVALPGELRARDLAAGTEARIGAADSPCYFADKNGWFCAFRGTNFTGDQLNWYHCGTYTMPWAYNGSWANNQTTGTRARFYNSSGELHYTTPVPFSTSSSYSWLPVYKVKPC